MPEAHLTDPTNPFKNFSLYDLRSVGQHSLHAARKNGEDTSIPLMFMGAVTVGIGAMMMLDAYRKKHGGHGGSTAAARGR